MKKETKSYFYKVSGILKYYVTKVIIIILNFLFEQDRKTDMDVCMKNIYLFDGRKNTKIRVIQKNTDKKYYLTNLPPFQVIPFQTCKTLRYVIML